MSDLKRPSALVTGGAGFIGSHTCKALARCGITPIVLDNLSTGHREAVQWGPLEEGDIRDAARLDTVLARHQPAAIIHFAASAYVGESVTKPALYYANNVAGTLNLLEAAHRAGVRHVLFSSSCATYGIPTQSPITEQMLQQPINPYGRTKLVCEWMLRDFSAAYGMAYLGLRYFNAAGADPDGELSEKHSPETHLIPRALMAASGRIPELEVFGNDYPTPDGTCIRDYVHVTDLAEAHVSGLRYLLAGGDNGLMNLGTGSGLSVADIVGGISRLFGRRVPVRMGSRRAGDPAELVADPALARAKLDFCPRFSTLETILRTAAPSFGLC